MSKRTIILSKLISHIAQHTSSVGSRGLKFLHEVNDFPAFYIYSGDESRYHEGAGHKYGIISSALRGYIQSDKLDDVEDYARSLEEALQIFPKTRRDLVEEVRVMSLRTDEGLMAPFGVIDLEIEILYDVLVSNIYTADEILTADDGTHTVDQGY